jgi:hypothetical protein
MGQSGRIADIGRGRKSAISARVRLPGLPWSPEFMANRSGKLSYVV